MSAPRQSKTVRQSRTQTTELVLPNDTNPHGTMFGGSLLSIMDKCASICARRHAGRVSVTTAIDSVEFHEPLRIGDVLLVEAWVNRAFRSSMEVEVTVSTEDPDSREQHMANHAFFTFVAIDRNGRPVAVPAVMPESKDEKRRYRQAGLRREVRLYLSGRLKLTDAPLVKDELIATLQSKDL